MSQILSCNKSSILQCSKALQKDALVAFPTETVYGLGANALSEKAIEKIFEAKHRPQSDPLIVHVSEIQAAKQITKMNALQEKCFNILGNKFWPGPLTLIVNKAKHVPYLVTAQSEFVGIRIPNHPIALELLNDCKIPVAAPSANRFGHISPTTAEHVFADLGNYKDLLILDSSVSCNIGIESTIIKIFDERHIILLRPGAISSLEIEKELKNNGIDIEIKYTKREIKENNINELESSGQMLTHYAPTLEAFILKNNSSNIDENILKKSVLLDFSSMQKNLKDKSFYYLDLSKNGDFKEASYNLFAFLRKAESIENAKYILLPDFSAYNDELSVAINDRIYRASSGKYLI